MSCSLKNWPRPVRKAGIVHPRPLHRQDWLDLIIPYILSALMDGYGRHCQAGCRCNNCQAYQYVALPALSTGPYSYFAVPYCTGRLTVQAPSPFEVAAENVAPRLESTMFSHVSNPSDYLTLIEGDAVYGSYYGNLHHSLDFERYCPYLSLTISVVTDCRCSQSGFEQDFIARLTQGPAMVNPTQPVVANQPDANYVNDTSENASSSDLVIGQMSTFPQGSVPEASTTIDLSYAHLSPPSPPHGPSIPDVISTVHLHGNSDVMSFRCRFAGCEHRTYGRWADFMRHYNGVHARSPHVFWCPEDACKRSKTFGKSPFHRSDKRDDHVNKAHKLSS